jgi:ABC-type transport system involved in multi-copper enzyme maturation permease subunit
VRLLNAEILKLVRRRGLMIWSLILTVGVLLLAAGIVIVLHAVNPDRYGSAGGRANMESYLFVLSGLGNVAAIIIGATAGTQDVSNGVFRDLVVTGRSRSTLFLMRVAGALAVFLPMLLLGFLLTLAVTYGFAGDKATPSAEYVGRALLYCLLITGIDIVIAVGMAAFTSSRVVVGVLIAWNAIVAHILTSITPLGSVRKLVDVAAVGHFAPIPDVRDEVAMGTLTAILVLAGWVVVFLAAGRWRTERRDA